MWGQYLALEEWQTFYPKVSLEQAHQLPAMNQISVDSYRCNRCGSICQEQVPAGFFYCYQCITLGRMTSQKDLYFFPVPEKKSREIFLNWDKTLSISQQEIAEQLQADQKKGASFLLWAVTGAGKTEMLFQLIQRNLAVGNRVCLTSPRVDVCNELHLRMLQAFPKEEINLYHGQKRIEGAGQFVICTVHQLLRYRDYFDLMIVDEVDAFPYANNPLLQATVEKAQVRSGKRVYLSATPNAELKKAVDFCYRLPARFHRRPLPVPEILLAVTLAKKMYRGRLPQKVLSRLLARLGKNDVLLFCPSVGSLLAVAQFLQKAFPDCQMTTVHAQDQERAMKVDGMRQGKYQLLITTTILERGVTFEKVSVVVLEASHRVFNQAALVQIAGRADRKGDFHEAEVVFVTSEMTLTIKKALAEIKENNQLAFTRGLLNEM
ncbi:helicase-related protein [Enterococcus sp. AZ103]|uniref:helicase-related protein n=1 Tax=Enterococcus sp. AZ103 TaxID=2774628 RepID=UPI003F22439D